MFKQAANFLTNTAMVSFLAAAAWSALPGSASATACDDPSDPCQVRQHMKGNFANRVIASRSSTSDPGVLLNLYTFEAGAGDVAADAFDPKYDLGINPAAARWYENSTGMYIAENDELEALVGDLDTHRLLFDGQHEYTVEMWIAPDRPVDFALGMMPFFSVATGYRCSAMKGMITGRMSSNMLHLWTGGATEECKARSFTDTSIDTFYPYKLGQPARLHHVVFTFGIRAFYEVYIDGALFLSASHFGQNFVQADVPLSAKDPSIRARFGRIQNIAGELAADVFGGSVYLIAVHDRILLFDQVQINYAAGLPDQPPVAKDDTVQRLPDGALDIPVADLLANDFDFDTPLDELFLLPGNPSTGAISVPTSGRASLTYTDGVITYTPEPGFHGGDSFTYVLTDDTGKTSQPATVTIEVIDAPIGDAGPDQTVRVGEEVLLTGSGSSTTDDPLDYAWSFTAQPADSQAALSDPSVINPTFIADQHGDYRLQLVVTNTVNGYASTPDEVVISTINSVPVADAGIDQAISSLGTQVMLDGSASFDDDGDSLTYAWSLIEQPEGSTAALDDNDSVTPGFSIDAYGDFVFSLQVTDTQGSTSTPDTVVVSTLNLAPIAVANAAQLAVLVNDFVFLDGSDSSDPNGDALSYAWILSSQPAGSSAFVDAPNTVDPTFVADLPGTYQLSLVVSDGALDSPPAGVSIEAVSSIDIVTSLLFEAIDLISSAASTDPDSFTNAKKAKQLTDKLGKVLQRIEDGNYGSAIDLLTSNGLLGKIDGCTDTGGADKNDLIVDCDLQQAVFELIMQAAEALLDWL